MLATGSASSMSSRGTAGGVPVVMLHGISDSWRSFERVLPHLPPSVRAIAVTQRGHGDSSKPDTGYRTRDFAADVAALADGLGLERFIVVGHSMGSAHAIRFAIDFPERIARTGRAGSVRELHQQPGRD
jgi:non-heme chloroperoxidase